MIKKCEKCGNGREKGLRIINKLSVCEKCFDELKENMRRKHNNLPPKKKSWLDYIKG